QHPVAEVDRIGVARRQRRGEDRGEQQEHEEDERGEAELVAYELAEQPALAHGGDLVGSAVELLLDLLGGLDLLELGAVLVRRRERHGSNLRRAGRLTPGTES